MPDNVKYVLSLDTDQLRAVARACEFYARVMNGQFEEIAYEVMLRNIRDCDHCSRRDAMEDLLFQARRYAFPDLISRGHSYGVGHDVAADRAWNAYQALRYAQAWYEHPEGGYTVNFREPYPAGGEAVPKCTVERSTK